MSYSGRSGNEWRNSDWRDNGRQGSERGRGRGHGHGQQNELNNSANSSQWGDVAIRRMDQSWRRSGNDDPSQNDDQPRQQDLGHYRNDFTVSWRQQTNTSPQVSRKLIEYKKPESKEKDYADGVNDPKAWMNDAQVTIDLKNRSYEDRSINQCFNKLDRLQDEKRESIDEEAKRNGNRLYRPGFGTINKCNKEVILWTNYFAIKFENKANQKLYMYSFDIVPAGPRDSDPQSHKQKQTDDAVDSNKDKNDSDPKSQEQKQTDEAVDSNKDKDSDPKSQEQKQAGDVIANDKDKKDKVKDVTIKGHLARRLFQEVLEILDDSLYATDFVGKIILRTPLRLSALNNNIQLVSESADSQIVRVKHPSWEKYYNICFHGPKEINLATLFNRLKTLQVPDKEVIDTLVDAVSVIVGHSPRADPRIAAVGQGKFFKNMKQQRLHTNKPQMLAILRGFFQSVRPSTNRLLLNVNVAYGVFRPSINLGLWLRVWQEMNNWNGNRQRRLRDLNTLHKLISRARVLYKSPQEQKYEGSADCSVSPTLSHHSEPSKSKVDEFTIAGFVRQSDECRYSCEEQCTPVCRARKRARGIAIDTDFPNASQYRLRRHENDDEFVTAEQHFSSKYSSKFLHPDLPLINRGRPDNPVYVPAERCWIAFGQRLKISLDSREQQMMKDFSCRKPYRNAQAICEVGRDALRLNASENMVLRTFGISIDDKLVQVHSRQLPTPLLRFGKKVIDSDGKHKHMRKREVVNGAVSVEDGKWSLESVKFRKPSDGQWTYLILDPEHHQREHTTDGIDQFKYNFGALGLQENPVPLGTKKRDEDHYVTKHNQDITSSLGDKMSYIKSSTGVKLILLIFPWVQPKAIYDQIKFIGDIVLGIHTVCVVAKKIYKSLNHADYFANVALKVNLKLGGSNHTIEPLLSVSKSTMFAGYDVIHPTGPGTESMKSQVGLVASLDKDCCQWSGCYWGRTARKEIDRESGGKLGQEFRQRVLKWADKNDEQYPEDIVIFRDGVSESQYGQVLDFELSEIVEQLRTMYGARGAEKRPPRITLVVAVKRHTTRFYPTDSISMARTRNIKPGTVVDRGVPEGGYWEFFLTAHAAIIGTARPARYVVLHDEIFRTQGNKTGEGAANALEEVTHKLCYMLGRATHAISLCTPAYMADILCTRARAYESTWTTQGQRFQDAVRILAEADLEREIQSKHPALAVSVRNEMRDARLGQEWSRIQEGRVHPAIEDSMFWI